jgi:hypothetical protein
MGVNIMSLRDRNKNIANTPVLKNMQNLPETSEAKVSESSETIQKAIKKSIVDLQKTPLKMIYGNTGDAIQDAVNVLSSRLKAQVELRQAPEVTLVANEADSEAAD